LDRELNWRGVVIFGLAVLTVIVLISVIDDEPAPLGVNTAGTSTTATTVPGASTTTVAGGTATTAAGTATTKPGATTTTKPGATTTTSFNPAGKQTLQVGSTGADVTLVQQKLTTLGFYKGPVDGSYGQGTKDAVIAFQTQKGISPADGVVGPATWQALSTA